MVNGVPAEVNEIESKLSFPCDMPGSARELSRQAKLVGWTSFTADGREGSQRTEDIRHVTLSYFMAQRAVEILGCENNPLPGDPAVVPASAE